MQLAALPEESLEEPRDDGMVVRDLLGRRLQRTYRGEGKPRGGEMVNAPQVFLVESEPETVVGPHFHTVDQFQLVVSGSGRLGSHDIKPVVLHYADAFSPYGPIVTASRGLGYMTLRTRHDPGAKFMPESRREIKRRPTRSDFTLNIDLAQPETATLVGPEDDGLAVTRRSIPAESSFECSADAHSDGVIAFVLGGAITSGRKVYPEWSCLYVEPGDSAAGIQAGPKGLDLLVMQFPIIKV